MGQNIFSSFSFFVMLLVVLIFLFALGFWGVDVSVTTMNLGGGDGMMQNMLFNDGLSPNFAYHSGVVLSFFSFMMVVSLLVREKFRKVDGGVGSG